MRTPRATRSDRAAQSPSGRAGSDADEVSRRLLLALEHAGHLLPAQGPITVFVHHNTLHAFEDHDFEEALAISAGVFGCERYLEEATYLRELERGRIRRADVRAVVRASLGASHGETLAGVARAELRERLLLHPHSPEPEELTGPMAALDQRDDPALASLWSECTARVSALQPMGRTESSRSPRHRDWLLEATGVDTDALVHPLLTRVVAAFLDQGIAYWQLPGRGQGLFRCFLALYGQAWWPPPDRWMRELATLINAERAHGDDALGSLARSLVALGVQPDAWEPFLTASALALGGWAGMVRQLELRPDRAPVHAPPASLGEFMAVRLLVERAALGAVAREELEYTGPLAALRRVVEQRSPRSEEPALFERCRPIFHALRTLDVDATGLRAWSDDHLQTFVTEVERLDALERRRLLHLAYERSFRQMAYNALATTEVDAPSVTPNFQALFCIDEREESLRRHLEEVEPAAETIGVAGFFGVAMYYQSADEANARPLCPVSIRPEHEVTERAIAALPTVRRRARTRRWIGRLLRFLRVGSVTMVRGTVITAVLGGLATIPLIARVLLPRLSTRLGRTSRALVSSPRRRELLLARRDDAAPAPGRHAGFTAEEMAAIVRRVLEDAGLAGRLAPLVLVLGHGSTSLNNPHESAHDCGACGGGRGGPNARAFAQMANDRGVRALLQGAGVLIPDSTWFVGAEHNTCDESITYYDTSVIPMDSRAAFDRARRSLDVARARSAHERSRHFDAAPTVWARRRALAHVEARAADLAQPRPEYGHATNGLCVVGRRARTRGLFLDRRCFLVSYDSTSDHDGVRLARSLAAVIPVVAGINLEYYFGRVDPTGYGCGTKLPHNVSALLGVMDGAGSDLRTGLPWQMVEIHEPVRLSVIVEARTETLERVLDRDPNLSRLVAGRWLFLAALDPTSRRLDVWEDGAFHPHAVDDAVPEAPSSSAWFAGRGGLLPFARIAGGAHR